MHVMPCNSSVECGAQCAVVYATTRSTLAILCQCYNALQPLAHVRHLGGAGGESGCLLQGYLTKMNMGELVSAGMVSINVLFSSDIQVHIIRHALQAADTCD